MQLILSPSIGLLVGLVFRPGVGGKVGHDTPRQGGVGFDWVGLGMLYRRLEGESAVEARTGTCFGSGVETAFDID